MVRIVDMYNFNNLSDFEFEILCKDIMQKKLGIQLYTFQKGRDGGIDITDNPIKKNVIIQAKHYINSGYSNLLSALKAEVEKVKKLQPKRYYVCCAVKLTAGNKEQIYNLFSEYMESANNVLSLLDINDFLEKADNAEIIRKHYKLWLESANVLSEIANQSVFVDCESLLYKIEECSKEFVATACYFECLDVLNKERMLLLLGIPGSGKTMTTKMLALYYASKGYRIRYTTNGELKDLKNALSAQKDVKEVLLLDDCLGQHYFKMKDTQGNELLGLVKYIAMNKNKKLIMNSRVTIFQQAKERFIEFRQFAEDEEFQIRILDMSKISIQDKGRIFYNQIYFKKLPKSYYQDIQRERNYKKIVIHKNYTPRIMEFVTRKANYKNIEPRQYFEFIMGCLNNPKEIWNDEFFEKLRAEDRIFMTTLYSLTDTSIEEDVIKRAFYYRIGHSPMIDITRNIWEEITRRLEEAFIMIIEKGGKKEIGVINPSVNDFLKSYLKTNMIETENIKQYATEYAQIKRGFADSMEVLIRNGKADEFNYSNQTERLYVILSYICRLGILNKNYECAIECFCEQMPYDYYEGLLARSEIIVTLLSSPFRTFYCIDNYIDESNLIRLFNNMDLNEFETLIVTANLFSVGCFYVDYKDIFIEAVNTSIVDYMENIEADDYYCEYEIDDLLKKNTIFNGYYSEIDQELVVEIICDYIREDVEAEVYEKVKEMPENILQQIRITREYVCINKADIENFIEGYYEPSEPDFDYDEYEEDLDGGGNEIDILDCIFG